MRRDKYGAILEEDFLREIELADTIEDIVNLREILENDDVNACLNCSSVLSVKESDYGL